MQLSLPAKADIASSMNSILSLGVKLGHSILGTKSKQWPWASPFVSFVGSFGYGSIPINTIFSGMNVHLPAILMFTRGTRFWHTAIWLSGFSDFSASFFYLLSIVFPGGDDVPNLYPLVIKHRNGQFPKKSTMFSKQCNLHLSGIFSHDTYDTLDNQVG